MNGETEAAADQQLLHLVFGGRLESTRGVRFEDLSALDIVGIYPDYESAHKAWQGAAFKSQDDARMRYFIVHLHKLLDPDGDEDGAA
ncbi:MAG: DUF4170 domain-containing protein [Alphaproteobacteria bacterium]|nr:DUF4170 domain-containing protein [Alphaproteobacteria bacterium]